MGFYNVQKGDAPYFKSLADNYAMSDNFHQSVNGRHRREPHHARPRRCDLVQRRQGQRHATPPHNVEVDAGTANAGTVDEVENPNPASGTNNWYTEDGYGGGSFGSASSGGGSYTDCADTTQPGVAPIVNYLQSLATPINPNCEAGHYYLLNNYNPGYFGNGNNAFTDTNAEQHRIHDSAFVGAEHRRRAPRRQDFVEVLRRSVEQLCARSVSAQLWGTWARTATSTATFAIRSSTTLPSWPTPLSAPRTSRTRPISTPTSRTERCRPFPSSSPAGSWTAIRHPRN